MKIFYILGSSLFIAGLGIGAFVSNAIRTDTEPQIIVQETEPEVIYEMVEVPTYKTLEVVRTVEKQPEITLSDAEKDLIASIVYAEGNNQDMIGKRLIVDTILNRVGVPGFADTVFGVVYQPGQFIQPAAIYTDDCMIAVEQECYERLDYNVLWFRTDEYHPYGIPAYIHGDHYFSWRE